MSFISTVKSDISQVDSKVKYFANEVVSDALGIKMSTPASYGSSMSLDNQSAQVSVSQRAVNNQWTPDSVNGKNMGGGTASRPENMFLNSSDAIYSNGVYRWSIQDPYLSMFDYYDIGVLSITMPNLVYPINQYNDNIAVLIGATTYTATVVNGDYDSTTFATAVQTALTAAHANSWNVTFNSITDKLTITGTSAFSFVATATDMYNEMGIYTIPSTSATSYTSEYPISIQGADWVQIVTNFATRSVSSNLNQGVVMHLKFSVPYGSVQIWDSAIDTQIATTEGYINTVQISFLDPKGNPWIPPPTIYWSITFRVYPRMSS